DNEGEVSCDDENSQLLDPADGSEDKALASLAHSVHTDSAELGLSARLPSSGVVIGSEPTAPYRVIGARYASVGGAEGTTPGQGGTYTSVAIVPRWLFYHTDHLGNSRVIMDVNGQVVSKHDFMPFGEERTVPPSPQNSSNRNLFTGHERDLETASADNVGGL